MSQSQGERVVDEENPILTPVAPGITPVINDGEGDSEEEEDDAGDYVSVSGVCEDEQQQGSPTLHTERMGGGVRRSSRTARTPSHLLEYECDATNPHTISPSPSLSLSPQSSPSQWSQVPQFDINTTVERNRGLESESDEERVEEEVEVEPRPAEGREEEEVVVEPEQQQLESRIFFPLPPPLQWPLPCR